MKLVDVDELKVDMVDKVFNGEGEHKIFGYSVAQIQAAPTITPANIVPHGCWKPGDPICPICGGDKFACLDADIWADWQPKFCPNCGAKMDGVLPESK